MSFKNNLSYLVMMLVLASVAYAQNHAPVLDPIGGKQIDAGKLLQFTLNASDADNDTITFSTNSSFGTLDAASGLFSWTPTLSDAGVYYVQFSASDGADQSSEIIMVNISTPVNHAPILNLIGGKQIDEGKTLEFNITATDPDGDALQFGTNTSFGTLDASTGAYSFTPTYNDAGYYFVRFFVTDGIDTASEILRLNVTNVNRKPVLNLIGGKQILEGQTLSFTITASDPDNDTLTFGTNSTLGTLNQTSGEFVYKAGYTDSNLYFVLFNVTDGIDTDAEILRLNVTEAGNQNPKILVIEPRGINVSGYSKISWNATDDDMDELSFDAYVTERIYSPNNTVIGEVRVKVCTTKSNECDFDSESFPNGNYVAVVVANDSTNFTEGYSNDFQIVNVQVPSQSSNPQSENSGLTSQESTISTQEAGQSLYPEGYVPQEATTENISKPIQSENPKNVSEAKDEPKQDNILDTQVNQVTGSAVAQASSDSVFLSIMALILLISAYVLFSGKFQ